MKEFNDMCRIENGNKTTVKATKVKVVRISMLEAITYMMSRSDESAEIVKRIGYGRLAELIKTTPVVELIFPAEGTEQEITVG